MMRVPVRVHVRVLEWMVDVGRGGGWESRRRLGMGTRTDVDRTGWWGCGAACEGNEERRVGGVVAWGSRGSEARGVEGVVMDTERGCKGFGSCKHRIPWIPNLASSDPVHIGSRGSESDLIRIPYPHRFYRRHDTSAPAHRTYRGGRTRRARPCRAAAPPNP